MPELPDVVVYVESLERQVNGHRLHQIKLHSAFVLRTVDPPISAVNGRRVVGVHRIGKRIGLELEGQLFAVIHLMIAGRLRWRQPGQKPGVGPKMILAAFEFDHGTLLFTEAASQKRASIQILQGPDALASVARGGIEPLEATLEEFREALTRESHTVKRSLTDPRLVSGIGNAYSDEILHAAKLSPLKLTRTLEEAEMVRLYQAMRGTLEAWTARLRDEVGEGFPEKVTAFHPQMAVHGRYGQPCPVCATAVQRIVYAANECNYCARCQTGGRLLADRSLSRLLKSDWPRSIDDL
jgi:formamidopyrimidine-DNA glycosylase